MTKRMKQKRFWYGVAVLLLIGGLYWGYHYWRYGQYVYYEPELVMKAYAFFNNGRAVVIDWEQKDKAEDAQFFKSAENGEDALNDAYSAIAMGQRYLATTSIKLKVDPTYDSLEKAGGLTRNTAKAGEYWTVNVYDLSQERPTKKSYDVFKAVRAYAPDKAPVLYYNYRSSYAVDGKEYLPIILQSLEDSTGEKEMAVMDLATGKIEAAIPRADFVPSYWTNRLSNTTSLKDYFEDKLENNTDSSVTLMKRGVEASEIWQLKDESPKALKLLQNGRSRLYILSNKTDPKLAATVWQQLLPEGEELFDNLTIYERFTVDGQEHTVSSYDEFVRYYKTTRETTEETDGRKDD